MHPARDHFLPPDPDAYRHAAHPRGRVIVIAPTRAACETIELALHSTVDTVLEREHGDEIRQWAREGRRFGVVAGTGTGKTLGIRPIAEEILGEPLLVGVVNREREATPDTPLWNVVVVTTGIARRWFHDELITGRDTVIVDEIHQTSAELELVLALGKRAGVRFIWLSATVDPSFYRDYLETPEVLQTSAFDPTLKATVRVAALKPEDFFDARYVKRIIRERRGVAVFVPTRADVERLAGALGEQWRGLHTAFYHGGEPIRVIRPFLEGDIERPWLLTMTAAGQSALNVPGLDTVVIYDARYANVVERGRNVLHRLHLGPNEILQMAGRVHGRVAGGEIDILTDRDIDFEQLRPVPPEFQLAGDTERVALSCAALGVDAGDLDLPVPLDRRAYRAAVRQLTERGLIEGKRLTGYGREVEALPVERPWGELLVRSGDHLLPVLAVAANIDSLHRMTREDRDLRGVTVSGSDHLTCYAVYAEAFNKFGYVGEVYGLPRHLFSSELEEWAEQRGVLVKALEDAALGMAAVYRNIERPLPRELPRPSPELKKSFLEAVAEVMPFDLVVDEQTADGQQVRVGRNSMAGSWGAIAGSLRFFSDRFGVARAAIEGTTLPYKLIRQYARREPPVIEIRGPGRRQRLVVSHRTSYHGFVLDVETHDLNGRVPHGLIETARRAMIDAFLAGETAHPQQAQVRRSYDRLIELYRRSGGNAASLSPPALRDHLLSQIDQVDSWHGFLSAKLALEPDRFISPDSRAALEALPDSVNLLGDAVPLDYELEDGSHPVVRLRLREGQARRLKERDLPSLDRPLRFTVMRGRRPAIRARSLEELSELLGQLPRPRSGYDRRTRGRGKRGRRRR